MLTTNIIQNSVQNIIFCIPKPIENVPETSVGYFINSFNEGLIYFQAAVFVVIPFIYFYLTNGPSLSGFKQKIYIKNIISHSLLGWMSSGEWFSIAVSKNGPIKGNGQQISWQLFLIIGWELKWSCRLEFLYVTLSQGLGFSSHGGWFLSDSIPRLGVPWDKQQQMLAIRPPLLTYSDDQSSQNLHHTLVMIKK